MKRIGLCLFFSLLVLKSFAQPVVSGYVKTHLYTLPAETDIVSAAVTANLCFEAVIGDDTLAHVSVEGLADWASDPQYGFSLKEAYIDYLAGESFAVKVGKQIVAWGLADGTNPTDLVNPKTVGTRYTTSLDEQKIATLIARATWYLGDRSQIDAVIMPAFTPNDLPDIGTETLPDLSLENMEGGLRVLFSFGNLSFSGSYLYIFDRYPDIDSFNPGPPPSLGLTYSRIHALGLDMQTSALGFDLRGEASLRLAQEDWEGSDPQVKNSSLLAVLQGSRTFAKVYTLTASWAPQYVFDFDAEAGYPQYDGQAREFENTFGLRLKSSYRSETIEPEIMGLYNAGGKDFLATASLKWNIADGLNLKVGGAVYGSLLSEGDSDRELGTFSKSSVIDNDYVYVELKLDF